MGHIKDLSISEANASGASGLPSLLEFLHEIIKSGQYQSGMRLPSERALAQQFGVDRSAIRTVLRNLEQSGLIVRKPGCRPWVNHNTSILARLNPRSSHHIIAVVFLDHALEPTARARMSSINSTLRLKGDSYRLQYFDTRASSASETIALEAEACKAIEQEGFAGAFVYSESDDVILNLWGKLRDGGCPVIFLDRYNESMSCDYIGLDNFSAAKDAVEYLIKLEHRRIGYLTTNVPSSPIRERFSGYKSALNDAEIEIDPNLISATPGTKMDIFDFVKRCFENPNPPTAFFALNDFMAYELISVLNTFSKRVPEDVSVIGIDDIDRYSIRTPFLTTMRQPIERMGQRSAEMMLMRLSETPESAQPYQHVLYQALLIERESCRPLSH
jgi:LacI family transcriptional regulator